MRIPTTFSKYIFKQFLISLLIVASSIIFIIILFDIVEIMRKSQGKSIPTYIIFDIVFLKIPYLTLELLPYIILITSILTFTNLTRSSELIVARASGISAWQFLLPGVAIALSIGLAVISFLNPISAVLLNKLDNLDNKYFSNNINVLSVSSTGLWLKQEDPKSNNGNKIVVHALSVASESSKLFNVTFFIFDQDNNLSSRIFTQEVTLKEGNWLIPSGVISYTNQNNKSETVNNYLIPTSVKIYEILNSYFPPENIPFWSLPSFITTLNNAGFPALRHHLYWHKILVTPIFLMSMVLFSATFSLRMPRKGKTGLLISIGVLLGFIVKFFNDIVYALGLSGEIPIFLAAWGPVFIIILVACALILHLEDG